MLNGMGYFPHKNKLIFLNKHGIYNKQGELVVPVKYHSILPKADGEYK